MTLKTFTSVWDALEDTPPEAASMKIKSELMIGITEIVKKNGWTQTAAAARCGLTQPRMNDLLQGKITKFSTDALVNIVTAMGYHVKVAILA